MAQDPKPVHETAKADDGKAYGLLLDARPDKDGNATVPSTPHVVVGLPGYYSHLAPTPVGGPGEATLDQAVEASKAPGCGVTLVELKSAKAADAARAAHEAHIAEGRGALEDIDVRNLDGGELTRVLDEVDATEGKD